MDLIHGNKLPKEVKYAGDLGQLRERKKYKEKLRQSRYHSIEYNVKTIQKYSKVSFQTLKEPLHFNDFGQQPSSKPRKPT